MNSCHEEGVRDRAGIPKRGIG
eukprot:gene27034-biopygen17600